MKPDPKKLFKNRKWASFQVDSLLRFKDKALAFSRQFDTACILDHNQYTLPNYHSYEALFALGAFSYCLPQENAFDSLKDFWTETNDFIFGFLSYDLKNEVEDLQSNHPDLVGFPDLHFFCPEILIGVRGQMVDIATKGISPEVVFNQLEAIQTTPDILIKSPFKVNPRISREDYLKKIERIRAHIRSGDIYEMNFCQEFFAKNVGIDPWSIYARLNHHARAPFSSFYRLNDKFLMGGSPERFLKKEGDKLISQPIKGTIKRSIDPVEDQLLKQELRNSEKDRAENVMIVDLVRNDLSRSCKAGSVIVEELFGIYGFEQVYQMISTVIGTLRSDTHFIDALKLAFPMGSMTGAPKVMSMKLIEQYEESRRGLYSGSVGYIDPNGDFDFNVVIRSILYNQTDKYLSYQVGGAIVYDSIPEKEYEECILKASSMLKALGIDHL